MLNKAKNDISKIILVLLILTISIIIIFLYSPYFEINLDSSDTLTWIRDAKIKMTLKQNLINPLYISNKTSSDLHFSPIQLTVFYSMANVYGERPYPWHFFVTLIHIINSITTFLFINKFIKNKFFSFLAALSFAVFYLNFYTMNWVASGISWGGGTFFMLIIFILAMKYFQTKNIFFYISSLFVFFFATFFKEIIIFTIPMIFVYYLVFQRKKRFGLMKDDLIILPYFILSLPIILITFLKMNYSPAIINTGIGFSFGIIFYRFLDFFTFISLVTPIPAPFNIQLTAAIILMLLFLFLIYLGLKNKDKYLLFLLIYLFLLVSIATFYDISDNNLYRFLYPASIAWFALLYYIAANIKNLKIKIITSFFLINYTIILNLFLILTSPAIRFGPW